MCEDFRSLVTKSNLCALELNAIEKQKSEKDYEIYSYERWPEINCRQ